MESDPWAVYAIGGRFHGPTVHECQNTGCIGRVMVQSSLLSGAQIVHGAQGTGHPHRAKGRHIGGPGV